MADGTKVEPITTEGLSLFVANLPFVPVNAPLDRIQADLFALIASSANVDSVKVRLAKFSRPHFPTLSRQLLAFANFKNVEEAKRMMKRRLPTFMGCHLRLEVSNFQRTLTLTCSRRQVNLVPFQTMQPWADNRERYPGLFQERGRFENSVLSRVARELCLAFGPIARIHTDGPPFAAVFSDFEHCQKAKEALSLLSATTGILVCTHPHPSQGYERNTVGQSESDIEFSSDCLPIKTSSSDLLDRSSVSEPDPTCVDSDQAISTAVDGNGAGGKEESPRSPLTESPPTPTLASTQGHSDSEVEEQERSTSTQATDVSDKRVDQKQGPCFGSILRPRSIDPFGVFVSHFPPVDSVDDCLYKLFSADGPVKQVRVLLSRLNPPSKFAFVSFSDKLTTQKALARHNQPFMGMVLNVRPRESNPVLHRSVQAPHAFTSNQAEQQVTGQGPPSAPASAPAAVAASETIRFGNGPSSPGGLLLMPLASSSPSKPKGASLPDRPPHWTEARRHSNDGSGEPQPGVAMGEVFRQSQSYDQGYRTEGYYGMPPNQVMAAPGQPWPFPPFSPMYPAAQLPTSPLHPIASQPPTVPQSNNCMTAPGPPPPSYYRAPDKAGSNEGVQPASSDVGQGYPSHNGMMMFSPPPFTGLRLMQGAEFGAPHWPVMMVDSTGQQFVIHPLGGCCSSSFPPVSFPPGSSSNTEVSQ